MDEARRYNNWIWAKRKKNNDSWEEQAFAEDAARYVEEEDYTWPPTSYSCSFCGRVFKSAQALGGHMNVHRRDKARLMKQPPLPPAPTVNNFLRPLSSMEVPLHSRILHETQKSRFSSVESSLSDFVKESRYFNDHFLKNIIGEKNQNNTRKEDHQVIEKAADFSVNFGFLVDRYSVSSKDLTTPISCIKRRRLSLSHDCIEELDLELRLGDQYPQK